MNKVPRFEIYAFTFGCVCTLIGTWSLYMHKQSEAAPIAVAYTETKVASSHAVAVHISDTTAVDSTLATTTTATTSPATEPPEVKAEPLPAPKPKKPTGSASKPIIVPPVVIEPTPVIDLGAAVVDSVAMLAAHNEVRLDHNLNPLTWSNKLAVSAQGWSDKLKTEQCEMRHDLDSPYGENIYWESLIGGGVEVMVSSDRDPVVWWANEEKFYNYDKNTCRRGEQCGHYTQLVWADTTEVGCGVSSCIEGDERRDLWVCRYNPPGNYEGMQPY